MLAEDILQMLTTGMFLKNVQNETVTLEQDMTVPAAVCYAVNWKESSFSLILIRDISEWLQLFDALSKTNSAGDRESASFYAGEGKRKPIVFSPTVTHCNRMVCLWKNYG